MSEPTRQFRLAELIEQYGTHQQEQGEPPEANGRYALVESSRAHGWITVVATPDDACYYHFDQEYASDWTIVKLVDLDTGDEYEDVTIEAHFIGAPRSGPERLATIHLPNEMRAVADTLLFFAERFPDCTVTNDDNGDVVILTPTKGKP